MISAIRSDEGLVLDADLPEGWTAYFDADWAPPERSTMIPALVFDAEGTPQDDRGEQGARIAANPRDAAAIALLCIAGEAVAMVLERDPTAVEVIGRGLIAETARRALGDRCMLETSRATPDVALDTTGEPETIAGAIRRLPPLGSFLVAGELLARRCELDLYPDVHVRGIELVGVGIGDSDAATVEGSRGLLGTVPAVVPLLSGEAIADGLWYEASAG